MQSFDLAPIGARTVWWSLAITAVIVVTAVLAIVAAWLLLQSPRIEVGTDGLRITNSAFGRTIPLAQLDLDRARRVDLAASPELRPKWRTLGIGLPGYQAGWFSLENGDKALLFVTDQTDAVFIPTRDNYALMLTPADPAGLLAALAAARR
jgi:hypothetical protein